MIKAIAQPCKECGIVWPFPEPPFPGMEVEYRCSVCYDKEVAALKRALEKLQKALGSV